MSLYIELINQITTDSLYKGIILLFAPLVILIPIGWMVNRRFYNDSVRHLLALVTIGLYLYCVVASFSAAYNI
ncbi:hypothetical protein QCI42_29475 [Bacillus fungorum]|uniref:hypothetical protein n=1 Tax=Bacillus fungorum TaxID=2039284 RepID=UPI00339530A8